MLTLCLYERFDDCDSLFKKLPLEGRIITPRPKINDKMRGLLLKKDFHFDVISINQYMRELLPKGEEILSKSEIYLVLASIWRKKFPKETYHNFFIAFSAFTDLRSFSLDKETVLSVAKEYEDPTPLAVEVFWDFFEEMKLNDEHNSFLYEGTHKLKWEALFGFQHLTGVQVDYLNRHSENKDLYVFLPKKVYEVSRPENWPNWLEAQVLDLSGSEERNCEAEIIECGQGELGTSLQRYFKDEKQKINCCLVHKNISMKDILEIPLSKVHYKGPSQMFEESIEELFTKLEKEKIKTLSELEEVLIRLSCEEKKNFRQLKICSMLLNLSKKWGESSQDLEFFEWHIFKDILKMNLPRIGLIPFLNQESDVNIIGIDDIFSSSNDKTLFCFSSSYTPLLSRDERYPFEIKRILQGIGPIKTQEFDFFFIKELIQTAMEEKDVVVVAEKNLMQDDFGVQQIFDGIHLKIKELEPRENEQGNYLGIDKGKKIKGSLSATQVQTYLDCPRKYYYTYLENIRSHVAVDDFFEARDLGILEHGVIQKFLENYKKYNKESHFKLCHEVLEIYLKNRNQKLRPLYKKYYTLILQESTKNVIENLFDLDLNFKFETLLYDKRTNYIARGHIDLKINGNGINGIIDFKRSSWSVASLKDISECRKIQLQYYVNHSKEKVNVVGYYNIKSPSESIYIYKGEGTFDILKDYRFFRGKKIILENHEWDELWSNYIPKEEEIFANMREGKFPIQPAKKEICDFCMSKNICARQESEIGSK